MTKEEIEEALFIGYNKGYETGVADMRIENEKAIEAAVRLERKRIIKKACEWLIKGGYFVNNTETIEDFKKAMEEEE